MAELVRRGDRLLSREGFKTVARLHMRGRCFHSFWCLDRPGAAAPLAEALRGEGAFGPVSATACDLGAGVLAEGFSAPMPPLLPKNPDWYDRRLREAGFRPARELLCYALDAARVRLPASADVSRRFGLTAEALNPRARRAVCEALALGCGVALPEADALYTAMRPHIARALVLVARRGAAFQGLLVAFPYPGALHAAMIAASPEARGGACALMLGARLLEEARLRGLPRIEAATVDADNRASRALLENAGGRVARRLLQYRV